MTLVPRFDRRTSRFDIVESPVAAEPGRSTATWTREGYLSVDAYTCRDGLLPYSDGKTSWMEYRPADELRKAVDSFRNRPVTDDHPEVMVSAETWDAVARGVGGTAPMIVSDGGVTYIRDTLLITSSDLLERIKSKEGPRCVSIGFMSNVISFDGVYEGVDYSYIQAGLVGNHFALVDEGRAGDVCRIYMDSAAWTAGRKIQEMPIQKAQKQQRKDELGAPVETVKIMGPDGNEYDVPTFVAQELQALEALRGQQEPVAPVAPAAAPAPVAPAVDAAPAPAPAPDPAPLPEKEEAKDAEDEEKMKEKEKEKSLDSLRSEFARRSKAERRAVRVGLDDDHIERVDSTDQLVRDIIAKRMPHATERAKTARGDALDLLADIAMGLPEEATAPAEKKTETDPWKGWRLSEKNDEADVDPVVKAQALYLETQGY